MQTELLSGRRLRFDLHVKDRESIPGAIAKGVRGHVLVKTRLVLNAAGVDIRHAGYAQLATLDQLERLAFVIRCETALLCANAGERVPPEAGSKSVDLRFGAHRVPRAYMDLNRRRISPLSLIKEDYHRLNWMNLLLPYCPESLERLVSSCMNCGSDLGWHYAKGIGTCEFCDREIPPSNEAALPDGQAGDYRLFANLASPSGRDMAAALAALPQKLQSTAPSTLVRLALQIGGIVQAAPTDSSPTLAVLGLDKPTLAAVISSGAALLRAWPTGLQDWVSARSVELRDDPHALQALHSRLRRLTRRGPAPAALCDLVIDALPHVRKHAVHSPAVTRRYYLFKEVRRRLGLEAQEIKALREWEGIKFQRVTTSTHQKGQFDADQIDEIAPVFRTSIAFNSCTGRLKLPLYAVEQCCRPGLLEREDHPALLAARSRPSVRAASLTAFHNSLLRARSRGRRRREAVPLSVAVKRIGGRLKPWGSILGALVDRNLDFWLTGNAPTIRSIFVLPTDLAAFERSIDEPADFGIESSATISQADAAEVLNIKSGLLSEVSVDLGIQFRATGRALITSRDTVLRAAAEVAWNAEISWHLGVNFHRVEESLLALDVPRQSSGWCRRYLVKNGILPNDPESFSKRTEHDAGFAVLREAGGRRSKLTHTLETIPT